MYWRLSYASTEREASDQMARWVPKFVYRRFTSQNLSAAQRRNIAAVVGEPYGLPRSPQPLLDATMRAATSS